MVVIILMRFNENTLIVSFKYLESKNMIINAKIRRSVRCLAADLEKAWKHKIKERKCRNEREIKECVEIFGFYIKKEEKPEVLEEEKNDQKVEENTQKESENKEAEAETITDEYTVERIIVKSYATPKDPFQLFPSI